MTTADLLERLDAVRPRGPGKWSGRCPAHDDRSPSLSIREGEGGRILLHDFGGCRLEDICAALGVRLTDLFAEQDPDPHERQASQHRRAAERGRQAREHYVKGLHADAEREARRFLASIPDTDISGWSGAQLHGVLNTIGDALNLLGNERDDEPQGHY